MSAPSLTPIGVGAPAAAGDSREGGAIELIVLDDDPRPVEAALAAYLAERSPALPHYYLSQFGAIYQLVADARSGRGLGSAIYQQRPVALDRIAIGVRLERPAGGAYSARQQSSLSRLLATLQQRHGLAPASVSTIEADAGGRAWVRPAQIASPTGAVDAVVDDAFDGVLGGSGAATTPGGPVLGDGPSSEELWRFLFKESWERRGGELQLGWAFTRHAARFDLGAPVGPNHGITIGATRYNFQALARDTVYNLDDRFGQVQLLSDLVGPSGAMPAAGTPARQLLQAVHESVMGVSEAQARGRGQTLTGNGQFQPGWTFFVEALRRRLGPALSRNFIAGNYIVQVFAGDTLYTPRSNDRGCLFLSQATPGSDAYNAVWAETYKACGAEFDPNSPFHRRAVADRLGAPLVRAYAKPFNGAQYAIQVFAYDTLFIGPDGQLQRMSELDKPAEVLSWQPEAPTGGVSRPWALDPPRRMDRSWPAKPDFSYLRTWTDERNQILGRLVVQRIAANRREARVVNDWEQRYLTTVEIPQLARVNGGRPRRVRFHVIAAEQLLRLWQAWENYGLLSLVLSYEGDYVSRYISADPQHSGYNILSNHAYGTAFDINRRWNEYGRRAALVGEPGSVRELVQLANIHGFYWGGHWEGAFEDGMHFEWAVTR